MSERWERGSSRAWRRIRAEVILRDGGLCQLRLDGCETYGTQVHHTQPWTGRPEDVPTTQLITACPTCNRTAGEPTADPTAGPRRSSRRD